jgi:hypothetical protein
MGCGQIQVLALDLLLVPSGKVDYVTEEKSRRLRGVRKT